ncbi:MAG: bis(5'-nucleosyl)-tetraphosphatase (symmetrical) YqeK [Negativicutes bacterium]|nr:bis(5'-nucleosyl)-tetraphosphatase (symmetrical) YqeK [Negativicutes bacterium]
MAKLRGKLSGKRMRHSEGVMKSAAELAERYGANVEKAKLAGILHDCAREMPRNNLLQSAKAFGIVVSDIERQMPLLLHAPLGSKIAQAEYGIDDPEILSAIALHTTGAAKMTLLDKIVYLADFIEPGRDFPGVDTLRLLAKLDLDKAVLQAFDQSIRYILEHKGLIHPATIEGRNTLLMTMRI